MVLAIPCSTPSVPLRSLLPKKNHFRKGTGVLLCSATSVIRGDGHEDRWVLGTSSQSSQDKIPVVHSGRCKSTLAFLSASAVLGLNNQQQHLRKQLTCAESCWS